MCNLLNVTFNINKETNERYYILLKQDNYSNAFSVRPRIIQSGQQFDVVVEDSDVLKSLHTFALQVVAETEEGEKAGEFDLLCTKNDESLQQVFTLNEYTFELPSAAKSTFVGYIRLVDGYETKDFNFALYGTMSKSFNVQMKDDSLILRSNECSPICAKQPQQFALILRAIYADSLRVYDVPIILRSSQMQSSLTSHIDNTKKTNTRTEQGNPPKFKQTLWAVRLKERSTFESVVILEAEATNSDALHYSLLNHNDVFDIDPFYGVLYIIAIDKLTIENLDEHFNLTVTVSDETDHNDTAIIMVTLEPKYGEKFSAPSFNQAIYAFAVQPNVKFVGQVSADVSNGKLTYRISEGGVKFFSINSTDGCIFYKGPLEKNAHNYTLKLITVDDSSPSRVDVATAQILIAGLESSPPHFHKNDSLIITLNKDLVPGTVLHNFIAIDDDPNNKLQYSLESITVIDEIGESILNATSYFEHFAFHENGVNNGSIYLTKGFANTTVLAVHLTINVADMNHRFEPKDKAKLMLHFMIPVKHISQYEMMRFPEISNDIIVSEETPIGSYIYTANLKPCPLQVQQNYKITYTLSEGQRLFAINTVTGIITTIASLRMTKSTNITVVANMLETQTTTSIILQITTVPSQRTHKADFAADSFKYNLTENVPIGSVVSNAVIQETDSDVQYEIEGRDKQYFQIDQQGVLRTTKNIDHEEITQLAVFIRASHRSGQFALASVTVNVVDEDDREPKFLNRSYTATVMENSPINTFILRAQAYDLDHSTLDYALMMNTDSANLSSLLRVDQLGTIYNTEPLLGYGGDYQFAIIARDRRHSGASATVFLTIVPYTKCQPSFFPNTPTVYGIKENEQTPTRITQFDAEVPSTSCELVYSIWDGQHYTNQTNTFSINSTTGELVAIRSFDFEKLDRFSLMVVAQSGDSFEHFDVEVRVIDLNDNKVNILERNVHYRIREDEKPGWFTLFKLNFASPKNLRSKVLGKKLGKIRAFDRDPNDKVYFHMLEKSNDFAVGLEDGVITLTAELDREDRNSCLLKIIVTNRDVLLSTDLSSDAAVAFVYVEVIDVNDNGPVFEKNLYTVAIERNSIAGTKLLDVRAKDPDLPEDELKSNTVLYRIDETVFKYLGKTRQANGFVTINEKTGALFLAHSPRDFSGGLFKSRLASSDVSGVDAHLAYTQLKIWLYDSKHVVELEIEQNPKELNLLMLRGKISNMSALTNCEAFFLGIRFVKKGGATSRQLFRAQFVIINQTAETLLAADEAISLVDRHALDPNINKPRLLTIQHSEPSADSHKVSVIKSGELTLLLALFASLLGLVMVLFASILCYHRSKYLREKKTYEKKKNAFEMFNKNNRCKHPPSVIIPPKRTLWEKHTISTDESLYGMQEIVMSVEAEFPKRRVWHSDEGCHEAKS